MSKANGPKILAFKALWISPLNIKDTEWPNPSPGQ